MNNDENINKIYLEVMKIVKERQNQIVEIKIHFDRNNNKLYKDIVKLNREMFEDIYNKSEFKYK
jgi:hypothetical protein